MSMSTAEILEKAAEYIEENGWWQGGSDNVGAGTCAALAIEAVESVGGRHFSTAYDSPPKQELLLAIGCDPYLSKGIYDWNDDPSRTKEEVCRMLRTVAARLDGRYGPSDALSGTDRDYGDEDPSWEVRDYTPALSDPFYG